MAVVKVSFTRRRGAVKAHLRYITHRPGKDSERTTRVLFGQDGLLAAVRTRAQTARGSF